MKTPRERVMAYLALGLITATLAGLLYFMYYDRSMSSLRSRERSAQSQLDTEEVQLGDLNKSMPGLTLARRMSLPADPTTARREYVRGLEAMFNESGFPKGKVIMTPKGADPRTTTTTGTAARAKPLLTPFSVDITAPGDLSMLTAFLDKFYRAPLLHRLKSLRITKPVTTTRDQMPGELEVKMTVEAIILDGAEKRDTLYAKDLKEAERPKPLARTTAQYAMIAGHNVFYGLAPRERSVPEADPGPRVDYNILPDTWLDSITIDDKGIIATIWDSANEFQYLIRKRFDGSYKVDKYYFIKDTKKRLEIGEEMLDFKDANDYSHRSFKVLRIDSSDVFLEDGGKIYRLHAGWRISDVQQLSRDEATKLGLVKAEKKDDKSSQKGEDSKGGKDGPVKEAIKKPEGR